MSLFVEQELAHRRSLWSQLQALGGPRGVAPQILRTLGIYRGAQGIWVDKERTSRIAATGVTVGLLHTGSSYADDLSADGVVYHYPKTNRPPGRDAAEVASTKTAGELGLPVFVITYPAPKAPKRDVHLAWIEGWDDVSRLFLISFGSESPKILLTEDQSDETTFELTEQMKISTTQAVARPGQRRFKFRVLQRYGPRCALCSVKVIELLDAAHICPKNRRGTDDPRNGLVLCALHHRAFDTGLIGIHPETLEIVCRPEGPAADDLHLSCSTLAHLDRKPHISALTWAWENCWSRNR